MSVASLAPLLFAMAIPSVPEPHYVGSPVCRSCHVNIAKAQARTAMARTWQTVDTVAFPPNFQAESKQGPDPTVFSLLRRVADRFTYAVKLPDRAQAVASVEAMVGGNRHGIGFLARVHEVNGAALARPVLVQTRYAWSTREGKLVLAPGCPEAKPRDYQSAFGLPLSPAYEHRCLECHGQPNTLGAGTTGGVGCETCHGPGSAHVQSVKAGNAHTGILNPKRLSNEERIAVCSQCHVGLTKLSDPAPEDLLVANQVVALRSSECFIQSRKAISCETCHNPHDDERPVVATSVKACVSCHGAEATPHAAICPVNPKADCVGCHMPPVDTGPFHLVDHLIRVHGESRGKTFTQYEPVSLILQKIELKNGLERATFLGRVDLLSLPPTTRVLVAKLDYGETTMPIGEKDGSVRFRRLPRDFKEQAARLATSAQIRLGRRDLDGAQAQSQAAVAVNPHSLAGHVTLGRVLSERGDFAHAAAVLTEATRLFPDDANAAYNLARVQGRQGQAEKAIANYRRAIASDPDFVSAYLYCGKALSIAGKAEEAAAILRQGLQIDPLNATLYRALGEVDKSEENLRLASAIEASAAVH